MPKKYVKLPVEIEAVVWDGENIQEIIDLNNGRRTLEFSDEIEPGKLTLRIETLEGWHKADIGDYIIKGIKGELYPCKPDIFEKTYMNVGKGSGNTFLFFAEEGEGCTHCLKGENSRLLAILVCMIGEIVDSLNAGRYNKRFFRDMAIRMLEEELEVPHRIRFYCTKAGCVSADCRRACDRCRNIRTDVRRLMAGCIQLNCRHHR